MSNSILLYFTFTDEKIIFVNLLCRVNQKQSKTEFFFLKINLLTQRKQKQELRLNAL